LEVQHAIGPFNGTDAAADARFTEDLKAILEERKHLATALILKAAIKTPPQISAPMRTLRASNTKARLDAYLTGRVDDQRDWYRKKSAGSALAEGRWFTGIVAAQILGLGAAFVLLRWPNAPVNATGLFAAVAAAFATWMQVRRHQELAQSDAIASHELGLIYEQGRRVMTDEQLWLFMSDAENAISREHTLWTARRDT
jgi:hypothetical protein